MIRHKFEYRLQPIIYSNGWGIFGQEFLALNDGRTMLEALFNLFMREANERNESQKVRDYLDHKNSPEHLKLLLDHDVVEAFASLHALSLSYISLACTVDGLACGIYQKLLSFSQQFFAQSINNDAFARQQRENEMKKLRLLRNKVTAHVSAVDPRRDSSATQGTSALRFQYALAATTSDLTDYQVGGPYLSVPGESNALTNVHFSLKKEHELTMRHFDEWEEMIMSGQAKLAQQCPFSFQQKIEFTAR